MSPSEYWAFRVEWSGEKEKSSEGKGEFPSQSTALGLCCDLQLPSEISVWSLLTWALPVGSVPEQISLAADSEETGKKAANRIQLEPIGSSIQ